jgi:hypothetical protein
MTFRDYSRIWRELVVLNDGFRFFGKVKPHCLEHIKTQIFQNFQLFEKNTDLFD